MLESVKNVKNVIDMSNNIFRYQLDNTPKKFRCPSCGKKTYVRYRDFETGGYLPYEFGRCDREIKCGYFHKYFGKNDSSKVFQLNREVIKLPNYHPYALVEESLAPNSKNKLLQYLKNKLGEIETEEITKRYNIGTASSWHYGTIFWQIDHFGNVHGGKIIQYNDKGKRFGKPNWVHSQLKYKKEIRSFNLEQCLFGLHLIGEDKEKSIGIVESEKTACVMSAIQPQIIWMATGSLNGLNKKKLLPIRDREIILYPDTGVVHKGKTPFEKWDRIAMELRMEDFNIQTSTILEERATEQQKEEGFDLADFFI